jgi:acetyl esterase/lipase
MQSENAPNPVTALSSRQTATNLTGCRAALCRDAAAILVAGLLATDSAFAQATTNAFPLWPDGAPGALGNEPKDIPTLTPFIAPADKATAAALVICPGGGYGRLADHEGAGYARFFNEHGITCFVLKYRLGSEGYRHPAMLQDASRAVRLVRSRAADWKLDPNRIGIIGSSAGGHLASTLVTHFEAGNPEASDPIEWASARPDLGILCYPVITMMTLTHSGSRNNLLGSDPSPDLIQLLSNELQVTSNTPPCFVWHTVEDKAVPVENSLMFASALRAKGVPFELHLYERGPHGIGLHERREAPETRHPWTVECVRWLRERGFAR